MYITCILRVRELQMCEFSLQFTYSTRVKTRVRLSASSTNLSFLIGHYTFPSTTIRYTQQSLYFGSYHAMRFPTIHRNSYISVTSSLRQFVF